MPNCQGTSVNRSVKKDGTIRKTTCSRNSVHSYSTSKQPPKRVVTLRPTENQMQSRKVTDGICCKSNHNDRKYETPEMNTVLREVNQMERIEALRPILFKKDIDLTPRSKAAIAPKVTQKLNFNTDQVIFRNLTPINVNDSILIQKQCNANPNKFKKLNKVPTPELCHWLEPLPALNHAIPEPEITLEFCEQEIDPFESYLRLLN